MLSLERHKSRETDRTHLRSRSYTVFTKELIWYRVTQRRAATPYRGSEPPPHVSYRQLAGVLDRLNSTKLGGRLQPNDWASSRQVQGRLLHALRFLGLANGLEPTLALRHLVRA